MGTIIFLVFAIVAIAKVLFWVMMIAHCVFDFGD
jgi:hypothetical protein